MPCESHHSPTSSTARWAARATPIAPSSPKRGRIEGRLNHIELTKPPLRPVGP